MFKKIIFLTLSFTLMLFLTEITSFVLSYSRTLPIYQTPKIYQKILTSGSTVQKNWWTEREPWGVWHKKSRSALHKSECFNVTYTSNNIGARDSDFDKKNKDNFVLLGDSFAEGWGVKFDDTFAVRVEKQAGINVLNFGSAGGMGPVQYKIIYEKLVKKFKHKALIVLFYPANDFTDNDYNFWVKNGINLIDDGSLVERYRPYYRKVSPKFYNSFIPEKAEKRDNWIFEQKNKSWKFSWFVVDHFWTPNLVRSFKLFFDTQIESEKSSNDSNLYSGYFDATLEQQDAAISFIHEIVRLAPSKRIYFFSIPTLVDYNKIKRGSDPKSTYWQTALRRIESTTNNSFIFTDLYNFMPSNPQTLYLECDPHWNSAGNIWAAGIAARIIRE